MPLDLVNTLSELVSIPSVNPMGRPVSGPEFFEYRVTDYLERLFDDLGLAWRRQPVAPKRENIIARLDGERPVSEGGKLLLWEAHQDTVPVDGMTIDPWTPTVRDGRIYGRGSCDIKGGMCAMLGALARLADERPEGMPTIVMACTVNEEHGFTGASALAELWEGENESLIQRRPDAAVIAEPTNLNVVVAHKGALRWRCRTRGRAVHSSQPHLGDNALYKMSHVLQALRAYQENATPTITEHPLCGPATLSVGTISGGISVNTVPDECTIEIDRRLLPGEDSDQVFEEIRRYLADFSGVDFEIDHEPPFMKGLALSDDQNGALANRLADVGREALGACDLIGVAYGTDASVIAAADVPSVVFGPGSIEQAHTCDEWLSLDELERASEVLYRFGLAGM